MIIDHKPNSGSPYLSTPNKSPSPFPHLPTPQQTAKSQQVHTHQSDESTTDTIKTDTIPSDPLLAMAHQSINTSEDAASDISNVLSVKRSSQIQEGHLLIMIKALHGRCSGGARWHDRLFDILQELKFKPSKADLDAWMRPEAGGTCYEYIAVYADDLAIAAKDPQAFCNELKKKYNLKLKGVGPLEYHLGCTYKKDPDGTLAADPGRYVNKILESYERMFKEKPRKSRPPLERGDHPELDTSELCDDHQTKQFQTLIGQLQWLISLGRFDIAVHVMSLSRFRAQPRKGHLDRAKRIVGYLLFLPDGAIRFRTGEPDFSSLKDQEYDWTRSVYSGACEQISHEIPKPLGKHGQTTHYVDGNLHHDLAAGKAVPAVLHFLNQTPIDAYSKRHYLVSFHRVKEAIAAKYISFHWKDGKSNPADILSKHWEFATVWPMLKPILFCRGETATQLKGSDRIPSTTPGEEPPRDARDSLFS